jgi:hypothetical protein
MKRLSLILGLLGVLLSTAFGQGSFLQAKIPFEFVAGGKTLPAGTYDFSVSNKFVEMKNHDTGKTLSLGYLTRIAGDDTTAGRARLSFDVQQGKHFVEAVWPDKGDGYFLHSIKGEHTHEIVRMK